jgi:hypothetical protein
MAADMDSSDETVRDPGPLWAWMRFFVVVSIIAYVAVCVTSIITLSLYNGLFVMAYEQAQIVDLVFAGAAFGAIGLYLLSAFFTARITYRMMKNAHTFDNNEELISPGWAVGWYFVPFANLVMPARAVGQIWRATFNRRGEPEKGSGVIGWWWAFWIISGIALTIMDGMARRLSDDPLQAEAHSLYTGLAVGYGLRAVTAILLLMVFGTLVKAQRNLGDVARVFD